MQINWNENQALLRGTAAETPVYSHTNHGMEYEAFPLMVRRLSGAEDRVNVIASRALLQQHPVQAGQEVEIEGEVRSFNNKSGRGSRLVITLYARQLRDGVGEHCNELVLAGAICKRWISYACSATMFLGAASFLGRPLGRGRIPASSLRSFLRSRSSSLFTTCLSRKP